MKSLIKVLIAGFAVISLMSCSKQEECPLDDFPYEIRSAEKMTIYVASEKRYPFTDDAPTEDELYNKFTGSSFVIKYGEYLSWGFAHFTIRDFTYEKGCEYKLEGLLISYEGDLGIENTFKCCKVQHKEKRESINLPEPQPKEPPCSPETLSLYVASDKRFDKGNMAVGEDVYSSSYGYMIKFYNSGNWLLTSFPIVNFDYEKGYEYEIEGIVIFRLVDGDIIERDKFYWEKNKSKIKKDSFADK